ncbi:related to integral membrane protein PTH11 [Phialocephala subalpina]|uniref:Related to integral membrane protein PTH11 n=1 Tax=Phialocephala subalpina TaxID=576137 RepID=A0A1L7XCV2_9HELO|nr:related to integral membrane protein PTH11 [Phialocephala subalpina]
MYRLPNALLLVLALTRSILAQSSSAASAELAELPSCALSCLEIAIESSTCAATNQTCICLDEVLLANATVCVAETCTIVEALTTKNVTNTFCGVATRDKSGFYEALILTFFILAAIVVAVRLISRLFTASEYGLDDLFTAILFVTGIASLILTFRGTVVNGLGKDIWTQSARQITDFLHAFYFMTMLYFAQVVLLKLTLLFFYLRIFPGTGIRRFIWATVIFNVLFGISSVVAVIFACTPINYFWHSWDGEHKGRCININDLGWANAGLSIAVDLWMLALPMSQLVGLRLHWKKKVGVASMFGVGTFVTIISILRLQSLIEFANTQNPTWDNLGVSQWSFLEISVGMMCACMPSIRVLLVRMFPRVFGSRSNSTRTGGRYYAENDHSQRLGNISVAGGADRKSNVLVSATGISRKTTFTVEFAHAAKAKDNSSENDETCLVPMDDLSAEAVNSRRNTDWPQSRIGE